MKGVASRSVSLTWRMMVAGLALVFTVLQSACGSLPFTATPSDRANVDLRAFVASGELAMRMLNEPDADVSVGSEITDANAPRFIVFQVRNRSRFHIWGRVHCEGPGLGQDGKSFDIASSAPNTWTVNVIDARGRFMKFKDGQPIGIRWLRCYSK